jgi:hypothetical protein
LQAHRDHAYQRLAWRCGAHRPVTLGCIFAEPVLVLPLAWLAHRMPVGAVWVLRVRSGLPGVLLVLRRTRARASGGSSGVP